LGAFIFISRACRLILYAPAAPLRAPPSITLPAKESLRARISGGKGLIRSPTISDTMIPEKTARLMYAKNREKIIQHARNARRGYFIVNFYNNNDVKISSEKDDKAEFSFTIPSALETLDAEFNKALTEYRTYGKKSM
jgi:hypothetical protein